MQVTFIIPSFNQGKFIQHCLDSIASQGLARKDFEVLVMDGGSRDDTGAIVQSHPLNPIWHSEPDRGQAHAVNKGLAIARGELVAWINSDDYYFPRVFPQIIERFNNKPELMALYGEADHTDKNGNFICRYEVGQWDYHKLLNICYICQPAMIFRRRLYQQCGGLNESFHLGLDLEYWLRIGKHTTPEKTDLKIAASRLWEDTKSTLRQFEMQEEALRLSFLYGDAWSPRRHWGMAENYALLKHPKLLSREMPQRLLLLAYRAYYWWKIGQALPGLDKETCWQQPIWQKP